MLQLAHRLLLDLADAFGRHAVALAELLQAEFVLGQPARLDDVAAARVERAVKKLRALLEDRSKKLARAGGSYTKALEKIDQKLQGVNQLARNQQSVSVHAHVQQLITDATDLNNLGQMYIWWMPWT